MKSVSCPCCGSSYCIELTDEKWECQACDNIFLVHNLSEEFQRTDEHISNVHNDLKKEISTVKSIISNVKLSNESNASNSLLEDAKSAMYHKDISSAYCLFQDYASRYPDSCVGYFGMYDSLCIKTDYYKGIRPDDGKFDGYDLIINALSCDDIDEARLINTLTNYRKSVITRSCLEKTSEITQMEKDCFVYNDVLGWNKKYYGIYGECPIYIDDQDFLFTSSSFKIFENVLLHEGVSGLEKYKNLISLLIRYDDTLLEKENQLLNNKELSVGNATGFFGKTMAKLSKFGTENNIYSIEHRKDGRVKLYDCVEELTKEAEYINSLNTDELISDINERLYNIQYETSDKVFEVHEELKNKRDQEEEDKAAGFFSLTIANWGKDSRYVYDYISGYVQDPKYMKDYYKNNASFTITGYRKSMAYTLQEELMKRGATAYVKQM